MKESTSLEEVKRIPNDEMVELLEKVLDDARAGHLREFCLTGIWIGGDCLTVRAGEKNDVYRMFGQMTADALEYRDKYIE